MMRLTNNPYDKVIEKFILENIKSSSRVIDVGCGTGWAGLLLAKKKANCSIDGVDINTLKIHRANRLFLKAKRDHLVHCHLCGVEDLTKKFGESRFEYVVTIHSIHHFENPVRALKQIKSILMKKGKLLLADLTLEYGEKVDDCARYSMYKIVKFVKDSGIKIISTKVKQPGVILVLGQK